MGKKSKAKRDRKKGPSGSSGGSGMRDKRDMEVEVTVTRAPSGAAPTPPASSGGPPPPPAAASGSGLLHYVLLALLGVGVFIALYLVRLKLKISLDPDYVSSCNLGGAINCDKVNISRFSELAGLPISLFAVPTYLVMGYLTWLALRARDSLMPDDRAKGAIAIQSVAAIGLLTVAYSAYLGFVSTAWIRAYCLYCIGLYAVNVAVTVLAFRAAACSPLEIITGPLRALTTMKAPVPTAALVLLVSGGLALAGYSGAKAGMEASRKRLIDEQFTASDSEPAAEPAARASDTAAKPTPAPAAKPAPTPAVTRETSARGTRGGDKTKDGYAYFEAPLNDGAEFWAGEPTAAVTVVKYADFQCAYCRRLADSLDKVKEKYHDRVRFVMKHFPMNITCNRAMRGFDKHQVACETAYAAHCAGEQGKFWEMHDLLYDNQPSLALDKLPGYAEQLGLDMDAYNACYASPATEAHIKEDVETGLYAGIYGTPRTYINNRLVTGSATPAILEYYIEKAFEEVEGTAASAGAAAKLAPKPDGTSMVEARSAAGSFFIDPYEAAITKDGRAVSQPGLTPAQADYFTAKEACERGGKRLCTEEEWVSACAGAPAIDNNSNKMFAEDTVEGNMYPYGAYHEEGRCQDRADEREGEALATGSLDGCRTPSGVFDLAGNVAEWVEAANDKPTLLGGNMSGATGAACNKRTFSTPAGSRNRTTGFRCCADGDVSAKLVAASDLKPNLETVLGLEVPEFVAEDVEGNEIRSSELEGQVTLVNFFASWCGPCKKEFPYLVDYVDEFKDQGFKIVGVGVDTLPQRSIDFAEGFGVNFPIIADADARLKGKFIVYEMPATFLVDHEGVVRYRVTGFSGADQEQEMRTEIEKLLSAWAQAKG